MIVICTSCQARFRVSDEKIGPRGAKVRCSRCQTVFVVHRELGSLPPAGPAPAAATHPYATPGATDPFQSGPGGDPFAAVDRAPAAEPVRTPVPRPVPPDDADPFGGPPPLGGPAAPAPPAGPAAEDDPFASPSALLAQAADPFAASVTPRSAGGGAALPVTDLSDLLGEPTPAAVRAPPRPPATPTRRPPPPLPPSPPPAAADLAQEDDGLGLALEERLTPPPMAAVSGFGEPEPPPPPAGFDPGAFGAAADPNAFDPGALETGRTDELPLALATERTPAEAAPPAPPLPPPPRPAARAARPPPAAPPPEVAPEAPAPGRVPDGRGARALAVNAAALAALILAAFALLAAWRSGGKLGLDALRPAAVLDALRGGAGVPFAAEGVTSGLYDRADAPPLLFVRGRAVSRATAAVPALRVSVEVVRDGEVIARGAARAGAVPDPEALHAAADAAALDAAARAAVAGAPPEVRPGDALPFVVAIAEHPADLAGASLRVTVEAAEAP